MPKSGQRRKHTTGTFWFARSSDSPGRHPQSVFATEDISIASRPDRIWFRTLRAFHASEPPDWRDWSSQWHQLLPRLFGAGASIRSGVSTAGGFLLEGSLPGNTIRSRRSWTSVAGTRYRIVVSRDLCPIQCCTVRTSNPALSIRVA
jgi:hypothetical protein